MIDEGGEPTIVIEGHSCHSAGSKTYNMVLSERRAKAVSDRLVAAGIPADKIKIVSRGQECPAKDKDGNDFDMSAIPPQGSETGEMSYVLELDEGWYG